VGSHLATWEAEIRQIAVGSQPGQIVQETLSQKYPTQNRAGRVTQVVERLPSKHESLSSSPATTPLKREQELDPREGSTPYPKDPGSQRSWTLSSLVDRGSLRQERM
jgi:hypothetical protein